MLYDALDYIVQLPAFEGPLDLLLRLIERQELDITTIALAQVADQYLAQVRAMPSPDPAALSAFLVMAARLLLIKSRALLPRPAPASTANERLDEGAELVQQLRDYQRYKQAAQLLRSWQDAGRRSYTRLAGPPAIPAPPKLDSTLADMIAAVERRRQLMLPIEPPTVPLPAPRLITVPEMATRIHQHLLRHETLDFLDLISAMARRVEIVVAFWAVLELLKRRAIVVEQPLVFGPITITRGPALQLPQEDSPTAGP